jgi:hypothetical protein
VTHFDSEILPVLVLSEGVLLPGVRRRVLLKTLGAYGAVLEAARAGSRPALAVFATCAPEVCTPACAEHFDIGTLATVLDLERSPCCGRWVAELAALGRVRTTARLRERPFRIDRVELLAEPAEDATVVGALIEVIRQEARRLVELDVARAPGARELLRRLHEGSDANRVIGTTVELLPAMSLHEQQHGLELPGPADRLGFVLAKMLARTNALLAARGAGGASSRLS